MPAPEPLDQTVVLAALGAIAKAAPDLTPVHHCNGATLDIEVPDRDTARTLTPLLRGIRYVAATPLYETSLAGDIAGCPVRVLITRTRRGSVWAA
jgi:hypothetical protein